MSSVSSWYSWGEQGEQGRFARAVDAEVDDVARLGCRDPDCSKTPVPQGPGVLLRFLLNTRKNCIKIDLIDSFGRHKSNRKVLITESHLNKRMASDRLKGPRLEPPP